MNEPIRVRRGELVRIYLVNVARVRPDQLVPHPRQLLPLLPDRAPRSSRPSSPTRSCSARASAASSSCASRTRASYMFHAHQSEFAELGWMGFFEVVADGGARRPPSAPRWRRARAGLGCWALVAAAPDRAARSAAFALLAARGSASARARRSRSWRSSAPCCGRARSSSPSATTGPTRSTVAQVIVNDGFVAFTATDGDRVGRLGATKLAHRLPLGRGRGLRGLAAHLDGRDDRRTRSRSRSRRPRPTRLLRADGPARALRRRDPGGARDAVAAVRAARSARAGCAS